MFVIGLGLLTSYSYRHIIIIISILYYNIIISILFIVFLHYFIVGKIIRENSELSLFFNIPTARFYFLLRFHYHTFISDTCHCLVAHLLRLSIRDLSSLFENRIALYS